MVRHEKIGFPISWDEHLGELKPTDNGCPVGTDIMHNYLESAHGNFVTEEEPVEFSDLGLDEVFTFSDRRFWAWSCQDSVDRKWMILVGSGRSPFPGEVCDRTWMHGQTVQRDDTPRSILIEQFPNSAYQTEKTD